MSIEDFNRDVDRIVAEETERFNRFYQYGKCYCQKCADTGWYLIKEDSGQGYMMASKVRCSCQGGVEIKKNLSNIGIDDRFTFDKFNAKEDWQKQVKDSAELFCMSKDLGHWFFIGGQVGSGKTMLCKIIIKSYAESGIEPVIMKWQEDSTEMKQIMNTMEVRPILEKFKTAKVLYIDDLFKSGNTNEISKADKDLAFKIIDYRYSQTDLITIISSELYSEELMTVDQSMSRIVERCGTQFTNNIKREQGRNMRLK